MTKGVDEQHDLLMEQAAAFRSGMESKFWQEVEKLLDKLYADAIDRLISTPPSDVGLVAELQAIAKVTRLIPRVMRDTIAEAESSKQ